MGGYFERIDYGEILKIIIQGLITLVYMVNINLYALKMQLYGDQDWNNK